MTSLTLACGPYLDETGAATALVLFLLVKPLAYFAFIQAFRYRVSRPIPMRFSQAAWLTLVRSLMGVGLVGSGWLIMFALGRAGADERTVLGFSWVYLYAERLFSWWLVGSMGAGLQGRRLVGWVISGTLIGAAFDGAMVIGFFGTVVPQMVVVSAIFAFIVALHVIGRRESLRLRFMGDTNCVQCGYDLTGNLSGRCPECGMFLMHRTAHA